MEHDKCDYCSSRAEYGIHGVKDGTIYNRNMCKICYLAHENLNDDEKKLKGKRGRPKKDSTPSDSDVL